MRTKNSKLRMILLFLVSLSLSIGLAFDISLEQTTAVGERSHSAIGQDTQMSHFEPIMQIAVHEEILSGTSQSAFMKSFSIKRMQHSKVRIILDAIPLNLFTALLCISFLRLSIPVTTRNQISIIQYIHSQDGQKD